MTLFILVNFKELNTTLYLKNMHITFSGIIRYKVFYILSK